MDRTQAAKLISAYHYLDACVARVTALEGQDLDHYAVSSVMFNGPVALPRGPLLRAAKAELGQAHDLVLSLGGTI